MRFSSPFEVAVVALALTPLACSSSDDAAPTDGGVVGDSALDSPSDSATDSLSEVSSDTGGSADGDAGGDVVSDVVTPPCTLSTDANVPGLDPSFVAGARPLVTGVEARVEKAHAIADGHGGYIVFGQSYVFDSSGYEDNVMAHRYDSAGNLDASFGNAAVGAFLDRDQEPSFQAGLIDGKGRIVLVGQLRIGPAPYTNSMLIVRLQSTGALDTSFGGSGAPAGSTIVRPSDCAGGAGAGHVAEIGDAIYVEGDCITDPSGSGVYGSHIVRIQDSGVVDATFSSSSATERSMVASGGAIFTSQTGFVSKLGSTGAIDTSFGAAGQWKPRDDDRIVNMIATDDGGVLVATVPSSAETLTLKRLDRNGAPETGFSASYDYTLLPARGASERCDHHWVLPVAWGTDGTKWSSAHLLENGTFDPAWGTAGVESAITLFSKAISTTDFVVDGNGGVLVVGVADGMLWLGRYH